MRELGIAFLFFLVVAPTTALGADSIAVIVNPDNPIEQLDSDDLRLIFQTKKTEWQNGAAILPLNQSDNDPTRHGFDAAVLGLDPDRVTRYWIDRKVRGDARPPKAVSSASLAIAYVRAKTNAIAYVQESKLSEGVKVIARIVQGRVIAPE